MSALVVLQLPSVQNRLFGSFLQRLGRATQFSITHQRFQFKCLHHVSLTGLSIKDTQDNLIVAVDQLEIKINPFQLVAGTGIALKMVCIQDGQVHFHKEDGASYSINVLLQRVAGATKSGFKARRVTQFVIERASFRNMLFSINDQQAVPLKNAFDIQHFTAHNVNAELANLKIQARTLAVDIRHVTGRHAGSTLFIDHLSTLLLVTPNNMQCKALQLRTACSTLEGHCTLAYDALMPPAPFKDKVYLTAYFDHSLVNTKDLAVFVPYFEQYKATYAFSGALAGKLSDLHFAEFQLDFGRVGSHLKGCLSVRGLPDVQKAVFDMKLQQSVLHVQDLRTYLDEKYYPQMEQFTFVKAKGCFRGNLSDLIVQATFDTNLGEIATDLSVQENPVSECVMYQGTIATSDFDLGAWLHKPAVQRLTMRGQINGVGLTLATAHFQLEARISQLGVNNYTYRNICAHGDFTRSFFQGKLTVDDPHLKLQADACINLNREAECIALEGVLERACLQALQITDRCVTLRTHLSIAMQGLSWDPLKADAKLQQFCFGFEGKAIQLETLHVYTVRSTSGCLLEVDSDLFSLKAEGDFSYATLVSDFSQFIRGYQCCLMHQELPFPRYSLKPYTLTYQIQCRDINPLIRTLGIDAHVSPNVQIEGNFFKQKEASLSLRFSEALSFSFKKNKWKDTQFALSARQSRDGQVVSVVAQLDSKEQQWEGLNTTEDLALDISWKNDQISFSSKLVQQGGPCCIHFRGQAVLLGGSIELAIMPIHEAPLDDCWYVHPKNRITLGRSRIQFQDFVFCKGQQQVSLVGCLSLDPSEVLHLEIKNYLLGNRNPFVQQEITGVLNATAMLQGTFAQLCMDGALTLEKLTVDRVLIGDIHGKTNWDHIFHRLHVTCRVDYLERKTVAIQGCYEPFKKDNNLQFTASFSGTPLACLAPLVEDHVSQLSGELHGNVYIHGSSTNPQITGGLKMTNAAVKIHYLNMFYQASGVITFADQVVNIKELHLSDDQQGKAMLQGMIARSENEGFKIDATGSMTDFKLLGTASEDNKYFYGTGVLSGSLSAFGPLNNMVVCLKAKTGPDTNITIPMRGNKNEVAQYDFIRFVDLEARGQDKVEQTKQVLRGFKLVLLLEITPDAQLGLLLSEKTRDAIQGRGKGHLKLEIETGGVLTMTGGFEFLEGSYNFSLYRLVNRTFKILPESKITWHEKPTQGILNMKAAYEQRVVLASLLESSDLAGQDKNKYPVRVLMGLKGALLSPEKSFSIEFLDYPGELSDVVDEFKGREKWDKKYAENQALSLLLFKEFSRRQILNVSSKTVGRNFGVLASQQVRNLTSKINDNLEIDIDVDLATLGGEGPDTLYLDLAYQLTDRLRISRKSSIHSTADNVSSTARLVGDWTVEYVLTQDGSLKAKLYSKYLSNISKGSTAVFSGGISLLYTKRFNEWREFVRGSKQAAKTKR